MSNTEDYFICDCCSGNQHKESDNIFDNVIREMRREQLIKEETSENPLSHYWLSFIDPSRPKGTKSLGVCVVAAHGIATAAEEAWKHGCNPGGEMAAQDLFHTKTPAQYLNRLVVGRDVITAFDNEIGAIVNGGAV